MTSAKRSAVADRFQEAIDTAATRVGLIGTDDYLDEWRRGRGSAATISTPRLRSRGATRLEQAFGDDRLEALARSGGADETGSGS